jgi:hypothetical protein
MPRLKLSRYHIHQPHVTQAKKKRRTKINEAITYNPNVARSESTIFRKMGLPNKAEIVIGWPFESVDIFCIPLNANRNAEI